MTLTLTDAERLMLANQYEILAGQNKNEAEDHLRLSKNLRSGHKYLYENAFQDLYPVMSDDMSGFVTRILGLYSNLKSSFEDLDDKGGLDQTLIKWPGFDGNNETELYTFTNALREASLYVDVLGEHPKDSHTTMVGSYRRMIARWEQLGSPRVPMSKENIQEIINARHNGT